MLKMIQYKTPASPASPLLTERTWDTSAFLKGHLLKTVEIRQSIISTKHITKSSEANIKGGIKITTENHYTLPEWLRQRETATM
jgi:hypothetical protein